jgi:phosphohistidine phosphatase
MTVKVRLFAALRELAGASRVETSGKTAGEVADMLSAEHGERFAAIAAVSSFMVNGERAERTTPVAEGDEVAILPPVSGGAKGRTLWLLRHAKSSWDRPGMDDRERPLSRRGARAAASMRDFIAGEGLAPDLVLCSSSVRTRETLAGSLPALGPALEIRIEDAIYTFSGTALLERVRAVPADVGSMMVIGHNPACEELAVALASRGEALDELTTKFPTGALAEITLPDTAWDAIVEGSGELTRFVTPRSLEPEA